MNYILFDDRSRINLLPFTFTRPVCDIRIGILTIREKWEHYLLQKTSTLTESYLSEKYPLVIMEDNLLINGSVLPSPNLIEQITSLSQGSGLVAGKNIIAMRVNNSEVKRIKTLEDFNWSKETEVRGDFFKLSHHWDIFSKNGQALSDDFSLLSAGKSSITLSNTNTVIGGAPVFIEEGANVECSTMNTSLGPIYIGKNAEVMEGCTIRGPFALCDNATLKMGTRVYGPTTVGPNCKVGGEINNSVFFSNSNKAHDGFLGNSVIAEWCNLGADTNSSNLKNNYSSVKVWSYEKEGYEDSGLQFCGLMMGDHSKCAINSMFNTGTVVGVNANIFGSGFPAKFIPSFSWDGANNLNTFDFRQAVEVAKRVFERRSVSFTDTDEKILHHVYNATSRYRYWEKS